MERYHREDVLRILRITARQLAGWERGGLFPVKDLYSFFDLLQIKKLRDLRAKRVRPAMIRDSLRAMQQQVAGMENPLLEAGTLRRVHALSIAITVRPWNLWPANLSWTSPIAKS